jgi:hypothetical protein
MEHHHVERRSITDRRIMKMKSMAMAVLCVSSTFISSSLCTPCILVVLPGVADAQATYQGGRCRD